MKKQAFALVTRWGDPRRSEGMEYYRHGDVKCSVVLGNIKSHVSGVKSKKRRAVGSELREVCMVDPLRVLGAMQWCLNSFLLGLGVLTEHTF